jgi:hypothetical protein
MKIAAMIALLFVFQGSVASFPGRDTLFANKITTREEAIAIATKDAQKVYRSFEPYEIITVENRLTWHIRFTLKNKVLDGGGPEYFISKRTGRIKKKIYWQ